MLVYYAGQLEGTPCYIVEEPWRCLCRSSAWLLRSSIIFRTPEDFDDPEIRAHELEHVKQRELFGPLFPLVYIVSNLLWGYERNPFEISARKAACKCTGE